LSVREVESIFVEIVERARALDPANARKWFDELKIARFDGGALGIACPEEANAGSSMRTAKPVSRGRPSRSPVIW
jgi:hypothetical protein